MNLKNPMVEFFERLGHKVIKTDSAWWYDVQPGVLLTIPYYKTITPSEKEIERLISENKLKALRYPTDLDQFGFLSNITVNNEREYDFKNLHQKARNQTRRGMENCKVEELDFKYIAKHALKLNRDTATRQGRESFYCDETYWNKYCQSAKETDGIHAWGAFFEGELASFLVVAETEGKWVEWIVNHSATHLRNKYANNALAFATACHFLKEKEFNGICYGLGSLEETGTLDHFKIRMGWKLKPIKQRLAVGGKYRTVFNYMPEYGLKILNKMFPKSYAVRKGVSMINHYRRQTKEIPTDMENYNQ
jgi:hypothetical protein